MERDMTRYNVPPEELEPEQVYLYLTMGWREPQNEYEKRLLNDIREIRRKGYEVYIPHNGI